MNLPDWIVKIKELKLDNRTDEWCQTPYGWDEVKKKFSHPKGCPKYNDSNTCPPKALHISKVFDLSRSLYLVHSEFNLEAHEEKMRLRHPKWTKRQHRNLLYWQKTSRKEMNERVKEAHTILGTEISEACPEAMGVNVFLTASVSGLKLDKTRNIKICRHVSILGHKKK